jgi:predicted DNA-binding transcriptional regulator
MAFPGPAAAMTGDQTTSIRKSALKDLGTQEENLDRALVTGLMLEVILETSSLPVDPQTLRHLVKTRLKGSLAVNLAGRITLDRFRRLLSQVDIWFPLYYPLTTAGAPKTPAATPVLAPPAPAAALAAPRGLRLDRLRAWLQEEGRGLLPHRPHRKLNQDRLWEFLGGTQGGWFRLLEFTRHFGVDRKTAWEYLQKFLRTGLLRRNQGRSAAVRYALATRFLVVRAEALEPGVRKALSGLPLNLAEQVSGWLIATGGEAFREQEWLDRLAPGRCQQLINRLTSAGLLEEVCLVGEGRMLQLAPRWLKE